MSLSDAQALLCDEGYYCRGGATTQTPLIESNGGNICPAGHFCPSPDPNDSAKGTSTPYPCVPGTYRSATGGTTEALACTACPAQYYCEDYASTGYQICAEGWYCEGSETAYMPEGKFCPVGYYCTQGEKIKCANGDYQDQVGQTSCTTCPAGYQCPYTDTVNSLAADTKKYCGQNYYCVQGENERTACPTGYYTTKQTASDVTDCTICPAGYICQCTSATSATDTCVAEFV